MDTVITKDSSRKLKACWRGKEERREEREGEKGEKVGASYPLGDLMAALYMELLLVAFSCLSRSMMTCIALV